MSMFSNIILNTDSYKCSQFVQYPPNTEYVYSYIESRGGQWNSTVYFGLQAFIAQYLTTPITQADVDEAELFITAHGLPFNRAGWEYIVRAHGGKLPVVIKSAPEGLVIPTGNVLATIENTDPQCFWLVSYLETSILRAVWYPTTVATNSYESKKIIAAALEATGDPALIDFKLHDFGARGVSSQESAAIGGAAHLINFKGTDTISALLLARKYYGADMAGFSIGASEHSTIVSWGRAGEEDAYRNLITKLAKPGGIVACVSDSYSIYDACEMWGTVLKQDILDSGATLVVRPDSGNPSDVVVRCLTILERHFGSTRNEKGYRVLPPCIRVIQGDGIDHTSIRSILFCMQLAGFSADNVAFGQGGALLQIVNRDTQRFAMKCSAVGIREYPMFPVEGSPGTFWKDGKGPNEGALVWRDVFKDPVTDIGKRSKAGRVTLMVDSNGEYYSGVEDWTPSVLEVVFRDGVVGKTWTFEEVRANANK